MSYAEWFAEQRARQVRRERLTTLLLAAVVVISFLLLSRQMSTYGGACVESGKGCETTTTLTK